MEKIEIKPLEEKYIKEFLDWEYKSPYDFYNYPKEYKEAEYSKIKENIKNWWMVVEGESLIGVYEFSPFIDGLEIGLGLAPSLTGKGFGEDFLKLCLQLASELYLYPRYIMRVWEENERAIHLYKKLGFHIIGKDKVRVFDTSTYFLLMEKEIGF